MKQQEQNRVAKKFGIKELKTYIHNLAIIRNIWPHDELKSINFSEVLDKMGF